MCSSDLLIELQRHRRREGHEVRTDLLHLRQHEVLLAVSAGRGDLHVADPGGVLLQLVAARWVERALSHVSSLPPKTKKPKPAKT